VTASRRGQREWIITVGFSANAERALCGVARDNRRALPRDGARSPAGHGIALMVFAGRRGARDGARLDSIRGRRAARELHGRPSRLDRRTPDT